MATAVEIANAYVALTVKAPGIQKDIASALGSSAVSSEVEKQGKSIGGVMLGAVGGAAAAATNRAISMISDSIGSAIARVDTMNNFPKIMANLGYSAEDASNSIDTMSTKLQGLPTSLDAMSGVVQQLAPLTGGLEEATDLSLALNSALLAGGKNTQVQANAMEQYAQMLAVGTVDLTAWRSIVSAMPGQVDQLAQSLLGASAGQTDLYDALKDGTVTFDQFNGAILQLNEEGANGFASFSQQALDSTDGLATGWQNMQTAITRNLANIIDRLQPVISAVVAGGTQMANALGPFVLTVIDVATAVMGWAEANRDWLGPAAVFVGTLTAIVTAVRVVTAVKLAWAAAMGGAQIATYLTGTALSVYNGIVRVQTIATGVATVAQRAWNAAMTANPIGIVITAVTALVGALVWFFTQTEVGRQVWTNVTNAIAVAATWLWESVLSPVFSAIGATVVWLYENVVSPIFGLIVNYFRFWGAVAAWLWENAIGPVFAKIGEVFTWIYQNVILPIVGNIVASVQAWGAIFTWLYQNIVQPTFAGIQSVLGTGYAWLRDNVFTPFGSTIENIGRTFEMVARAIGVAWDGIKAAAAGPINFVLGTVWNDGLLGFWNPLVEGLGLPDMKLPEAQPVKQFADGGVENHVAQIARGGAMRLWAEPETGGEAYIPLSPAKRGRSTAILADVAQRFGFGLTQFANGGILDNVGSFVGDVLNNLQDAGTVAWEFISNPAKAIQTHVIDGIIGPLSAGQNVFGRAVAGMASNALKSLTGMFADAAPAGPTGAGMGWQSMWRIVQSAIPGVIKTSDFRGGARTVNGGQSYHGLGRAIDLIPASMATFNAVARLFPNASELIYSPAGRRQLLNGQPFDGWSDAVRRQHYNHVHLAMANGGVIPKLYDEGGWLPHGGMALNLSGRPEPVFTGEQWDTLQSNRGMPSELVVVDVNGDLIGRMRVEAEASVRSAQRRSGVTLTGGGVSA